VKLGGIVESVVFLYILGNVIPGTTLSAYTKTSSEYMYKVSDSGVSYFTSRVFPEFIDLWLH
jgi:hypothetical protein